MKILLVLPSHLKTVPMNHFSAKALADLGHDVVIESYHAGFFDKALNKIRNCFTPPPPRSIGIVLIIAFKKLLPILSLICYSLYYGVKLSVETLCIAKSGIKTAC